MAHNETFNFEYNSGREYNSSVKYNSGREYNSSVKHNSGREYNSNMKHKFVPSTFSAATHRPRYKIYNPEGVESTELTYGKLTTAFLSRTGGFGYPEILDSRRGVKKTFWILLTVACCCALFVHTYSLISRFSQFPVTTEVTVVNTKILDFPAVTICNSNMLAVHSPANTSNTSFDYKNARTVNNQINYLKLNNSQLGHQKEDFILSATFNSIPLALDDFELSLHGLYGNCFTFNANGSAQVRRSVHGFYGLELVLNIETYKYYMGPLTYPLDFAAAWLKVSKPGAAFKIEEMSVAVSPNTINILSIHQTNFARLGVPYGDCFREDDPKPLLYQKNKSYDKDLCDNTCLQRAVIQ